MRAIERATTLEGVVRGLHDRRTRQPHAADRHDAQRRELPALYVDQIRAPRERHQPRDRDEEAQAVGDRAQSAAAHRPPNGVRPRT